MTTPRGEAPATAPAPFCRKPAGVPTPAAFSRTGAAAEPAELLQAPSAPAARPAGPTAPPVPPVAAPEPAPQRIPPEFLHRLAVSIDTLRLHADRLTELSANDAIAVGAAIARRILESELRTEPEKLLPLVRSALRKVGESRQVQVRLSPVDAEAVLSAGARFSDESAATKVRVVADPALAPGDVQIDADFGTVDGRLETRLAEVRQALAAAHAGDAA